jgi:hypothetical protein
MPQRRADVQSAASSIVTVTSRGPVPCRVAIRDAIWMSTNSRRDAHGEVPVALLVAVITVRIWASGWGRAVYVGWGQCPW